MKFPLEFKISGGGTVFVERSAIEASIEVLNTTDGVDETKLILQCGREIVVAGRVRDVQKLIGPTDVTQ